MTYNPNQLRDPAGSETGGQWTSQQLNTFEKEARKAAGLKTTEQQWKDKNIEIAQSAPKTKPSKQNQTYIDNAYFLGQKARQNGITSFKQAVISGDYDEIMNYDFSENAAFDAAIQGNQKPYWVNGWRYGLISKNGRSNNFAEGQLENGLSVMAIDNGMTTQTMGFEMFGGSRGNQDKIYVSGFLNTNETGGDGEPLLLYPIQTGYVKK